MVDTPAENIGSFTKPTRARRAPAAPKVSDRIDPDSKAILEGLAKNPATSFDDFAEQHQKNLVTPNRDHFAEMAALHDHLTKQLDALKATAVDDPAEKVAAGTGTTAKQKGLLYNQVDGLLTQAADSIGNAQNTHFSNMFASAGQTAPVTSLNPSLFKRARVAVDNPAPNEVVSPGRVNQATTSDEHLALAGNILGQAAHTLVTYGAALGKPFANRVGKHFGTVGDVAESIARHYKVTWGGKSPEERMKMGQEMPGRLGAQARKFMGAPERGLSGFFADQLTRRGAVSRALMVGTMRAPAPAIEAQPDQTMEPARKAAVKHVVATNPYQGEYAHSRLEGGTSHPDYARLRAESEADESNHWSSVFSSIDLSDPEKYLREHGQPVPERGPGAVAAVPEEVQPFVKDSRNLRGKQVADQETAFATYKENREASDAIDRQNELEDQQKAAEESRQAASSAEPAAGTTYAKKDVRRFELAHNRVVDTFNKVNSMAKAAADGGTVLHPDVTKLLGEAAKSLRNHQQILNETDRPDAFKLNNHVATAMDKVHNAALRLRGSGYQNDALNKLIETGASEDARAAYESATMRQSGAYQMPIGGGEYAWKRGVTGGYLGLASAAFPKTRGAVQAAALGALAKRATPKYILDLPGNASLVAHNMDTDTVHNIGDVLPAGRYRVLAHASDSRMHVPTMSPSVSKIGDTGKKETVHGTPAMFTPILGHEGTEVKPARFLANPAVTAVENTGTENNPNEKFLTAGATFLPGLVASGRPEGNKIGPARVHADGTFEVFSPQKLHSLMYASKVVRSGVRTASEIGMQGYLGQSATPGQRLYMPGDRLHNYELTDEPASPFPIYGEPGSAKPRAGRTKGAFLGVDLDEQAEELLARQKADIEANPTAGPTERSESGDFVENTGERPEAASAAAAGAARIAGKSRLTDEAQFADLQSSDIEREATNEDVTPTRGRGRRKNTRSLRDEAGF